LSASFVVEYLFCEDVHTFTYDLFAEKMGFKLAWGCLCFYPFFYPVGVLPLVATSSSHDLPGYFVARREKPCH
jgi:hypothetical protein